MGRGETEGEDAIALGARVRAFREARHLSLRGLAARAGTSPSLISQFERGRSNVSIGTLRRIADALGLATADLFESGDVAAHRLVRRHERPRLTAGPGTRKYLVSTPPATHVEVYTGELEPGAVTGEEPYAHGSSQEILLVLRGSVVCEIAGDAVAMEAGDSVEYRTDVPHRVRGTGTGVAEVLWVISPPTVR